MVAVLLVLVSLLVESAWVLMLVLLLPVLASVAVMVVVAAIAAAAAGPHPSDKVALPAEAGANDSAPPHFARLVFNDSDDEGDPTYVLLLSLLLPLPLPFA